MQPSTPPVRTVSKRKAEPRTAVLTFKVTERLKQQIDAAAAKDEQPRSEYLYCLLDEHYRKTI